MDYTIATFVIVIASAVILVPLLDMLTQVSRLMDIPFNPGSWTTCAEQLAKAAGIPDLTIGQHGATGGRPACVKDHGQTLSLRLVDTGNMYVLLCVIIALADCVSVRSQPHRRSLAQAAHLFNVISSLIGSGLIIMAMVAWVRHGVNPLPLIGIGVLALGSGALAGLWSFRIRRLMISTSMAIAGSLQDRHPELPDRLRRLFTSQVKGLAWFMIRKCDITDGHPLRSSH